MTNLKAFEFVCGYRMLPPLFQLPGEEKPKGSKGSKGSIAYAALHARTEAFLKASRNYQVAVKGPLMDATDVYLQEKARMNSQFESIRDI